MPLIPPEIAVWIFQKPFGLEPLNRAEMAWKPIVMASADKELRALQLGLTQSGTWIIDQLTAQKGHEHPQTLTTPNISWTQFEHLDAFGYLGQCILIVVKWSEYSKLVETQTLLLPILYGHPPTTLPPKKWWGIPVASASAVDAGQSGCTNKWHMNMMTVIRIIAGNCTAALLKSIECII